MKKTKNQEEMLQLPAEIRSMCGFGNEDHIAVRAAGGVCVIHKKALTVLELAQIIDTLSELTAHLTVQLAGAAGLCDGCGDLEEETPTQCVANCNLCKDLLNGSLNIHVPDYLLSEAGIPEDAKLEAAVDEDSGEIVVTQAEIQQDISDLSAEVLSVLKASGVCLAKVDELIMLEEIVYGE